MKARFIILFVMILSFTVIPGCQEEDRGPQDIPAQPGAKIKHILVYPGVDATAPQYVESEYEYDSLGRISRVTHPMYTDREEDGTREYELYQYDLHGKLQEISNYNYNATPGLGFINLWNRTYSYSSDGRLYKVTTSYGNPADDQYTVYHYEDKRVVLTENYRNGNTLENYNVKEYNKKGEFIKESDYSPDNQLQAYTLHSYSDGLQVLSQVYHTFPEVYMIRKIERTFDNNGNLDVLLSSELAPWSSMMSYKLKYEYY